MYARTAEADHRYRRVLAVHRAPSTRTVLGHTSADRWLTGGGQDGDPMVLAGRRSDDVHRDTPHPRRSSRRTTPIGASTWTIGCESLRATSPLDM